MNRIDAVFQQCRAEGRKALVTYVCAGDPDLGVTERLLPALAVAGADVVEVGVPFSDPMADGPTIQLASQRALAAGTTLPKILAMVRRVRERTAVPLVLFSYYNVLLQYGVERLAADSAAAGIDGWLVVDVPHEEADEVVPLLRPHGLHWIVLVAPTTPVERARRLLAQAGGFVYAITVTGVTGARSALPEDLLARLQTLREMSPAPVVAGFGISTPEQAAQVASCADGVVVGSQLVSTLAGAATPAAGIAAAAGLVRSLAQALRPRV